MAAPFWESDQITDWIRSRVQRIQGLDPFAFHSYPAQRLAAQLLLGAAV